MVRASDLQPRDRSTPCNDPQQVVHTHVSPSSINWYRRKLGAKQALHATHWPQSVDLQLRSHVPSLSKSVGGSYSGCLYHRDGDKKASKSLHKLPFMQCTFLPPLFLRRRPYSCLRRTWLDDVRKGRVKGKLADPGSPTKMAVKPACADLHVHCTMCKVNR